MRDREEIQATRNSSYGLPCFAIPVSSGSTPVHSRTGPGPHSPGRPAALKRRCKHSVPLDCQTLWISKALMPIRTLLFCLFRLLQSASLYVEFMSPLRAGARCMQMETAYQWMELKTGGGRYLFEKDLRIIYSLIFPNQ